MTDTTIDEALDLAASKYGREFWVQPGPGPLHVTLHMMAEGDRLLGYHMFADDLFDDPEKIVMEAARELVEYA